jgi:hypothetical protein
MGIVDSAVGRTKLLDSWPELLGDSSCKEVVGMEKNRLLSDERGMLLRKVEKGMKRG